jgi:hypothetical protein
MHFLGQNARRESAGGNKTCMTERDLTRKAREQHQGQRADGCEENLRDNFELKRRCEEWKDTKQNGQACKGCFLCVRLKERQLLGVTGAEITKTRSSSSRVPSKPQGLKSSTTMRTRNGTASDNNGSMRAVRGIITTSILKIDWTGTSQPNYCVMPCSTWCRLSLK